VHPALEIIMPKSSTMRAAFRPASSATLVRFAEVQDTAALRRAASFPHATTSIPLVCFEVS